MKQIQKKMTIRISQVLVLIALFMGYTSSAQKFSVESMKMELDPSKPDGDRNYDDLVRWAEETKEHPKTANDPKMWYYRGLTFLKISTMESELSKNYPNALELAHEGFLNAIKTDAKNHVTEMAEGNLLNVAVGFYNKGYVNYQANDFATAYTSFETALPLMKYDVDNALRRNNLTAEVLEQMMAYCAMNNGESEKAIQAFNSLVDKGSTDPTIFASLAQLQLKAGDTTGALATVDAGKELNESDKTLINMELDIYLKQGRSTELIDKLNAAIDADPASTIYYFARAISYEGLNEIEKAAADYDKIIEIDPEYYDAYYNKGVMYLNEVAAIVQELDGEYKPSIIEAKEAQISMWYVKAIAEFEKVFEENEEMPLSEKVELANTMKKIYARLERMDDYNRMKLFEEDNK